MYGSADSTWPRLDPVSLPAPSRRRYTLMEINWRGLLRLERREIPDWSYLESGHFWPDFEKSLVFEDLTPSVVRLHHSVSSSLLCRSLLSKWHRWEKTEFPRQ